MRITELTLSCHRLNDQLAFYRDTLGLPIWAKYPDQFITQVGWTKLRSQQSQAVHYYHYCFLWPVNQLEAGIIWLQERLNLVSDRAHRASCTCGGTSYAKKPGLQTLVSG